MNPMLEAAMQYAARGWPVFRLTGYKTPFKGSHGFKDATVDKEVIERWWGSNRRVTNIGLATGPVLVVDADGAGLEELKALARVRGGMPRTLTARTSNGWHFYFSPPADARGPDPHKLSGGMVYRSSNAKRAAKGDPGVDLKGWGGYVVIPPSVNARTGFQYVWALDVPPAVMPAWLADYWKGRVQARKLGPPIRGSASLTVDFVMETASVPAEVWSARRHTVVPGRLADRALASMRQAELPGFLQALKVLPAASYNDWFRIGAAIHDFDPGEGGLRIFRAWSAKAPGYDTQEDAGACEGKWREYERGSASGERVTVATVYKLARDAIAADPHLARNGESPLGDEGKGAIAGENGAIEPGSGPVIDVFGEELGKGEESESLGPLDQLNAKYAAIGDIGGKCLVMGWVRSKVDAAVQVPSFQTFKSFSERYAHQYVLVKTEKKNGDIEDEAKQLGSQWLKWTKRRSYEGIDLVPGASTDLPGGYLNLWSGFAVEPTPGDWSKLKWHVQHILARGEQESVDYIFKFAAWAVQHPDEHAEVALVFRGGKGSGKGTFANALKRLFGQHGLQIFNSKHLVGSFNGHLRNCLLLFADEAFWAGDKQGESVLKGLITEPALMIEQKGVDAAPWKNRLHVIMSANAEWVVPASHDERRYCVFDVSGDKVGDRAYFRAVHNEMLGGGLAAMLHDLLALDLGDWHPRNIVYTEALRQQKLNSLAPEWEWWENILQTGALPARPLAREGLENERIISAATLLNIVRNDTPRLNAFSARRLGNFLKRCGCEGLHTRNGNFWKIAELNEARMCFERLYGKWVWPEEIDAWLQN